MKTRVKQLANGLWVAQVRKGWLIHSWKTIGKEEYSMFFKENEHCFDFCQVATEEDALNIERDYRAFLGE